VTGAHDRRGATAGDHPLGLTGQLGLAVGVEHDASLGLADDLAGHDHDVAVLEDDQSQDVGCQVVALEDLRCAVGRLDAESAARRPGQGPHVTRSIAAAAIAAVVSTSLISSGTALQARWPARTLSTCAASVSAISQPSRSPPSARAP